MKVRGLWGALVLFLCVGVPLHAEMTLSTSNAPAAADLDPAAAHLPAFTATAATPSAVPPAPRPQSLRDRLGGLFGSGFQLAEAPAGLRLFARSPAAALPGRIYYDPAWVDARPRAEGDAEWRCLAEALYFEARGESIQGQFAVAEVILNRVASRAYPDTVCGVVHQGTGRQWQCQFTWTCDGKSDQITERRAFARVGKIARLMLDGAPRVLTEGATHYHTRLVSPAWARRFQRTVQIGVHYFYRNS